MMSKNLKNLVTSQTTRYLATAHASKPKSSSGAKPGEIQVSSLPSGVTIASVGSDSALARVAVVVKAGARYEPTGQLGLSHILRAAAGYSTANYTGFGITRNIEYFGGRLSVTGTRDTISYLLETHQDDHVIGQNFAMLADTLTQPRFFQWELDDDHERIQADLSVLNDTPYIQLAEALHATAFKGSLRNSLYTPKFMLGKHTTAQLLAYVKERIVGPNVAVVGVGLEHQELVQLVGKSLNLNSHQTPLAPSKFIGGELHLDSSNSLTYVALAAEGASLKKPKDVAALALFQTILGSGAQIANTTGLSQVTRLGRAVSAQLSGKSATDVAVSAFSLNYEDTGLFGINLIAPNTSDVTGLVKSAVKELRAAAAAVTEAELADAKKSLKTETLLTLESGDSLATELGQQLLLSGAQVDISKEIDSVSAADLKTVAGRLLKSKLALVSIGSNAPYLEDIIPESN